MDESTAEQWAVIGAETMANQARVADEILGMLRRLEGITDGFSTTNWCTPADRDAGRAGRRR